MSSRIPKWLLLCVGATALGMAVFGVAWRVLSMGPLDIHLRDDAYYYFVWAENLLAGVGPCVTEGVATSGVHILWGLLLAAASTVTELPWGSVYLGLSMHCLCALVIYRAAAPDRALGCLAGSVYLGSHFLTYEAMNGQETAVACLALAGFLIGYRRSLSAFFVLAVVVVAARSDLIFLVAALALSQAGLRRARVLATFGVLGCYAAWNVGLSGYWLQDSANPIPWLMREEFRFTGTPVFERWQPHLMSMLQFIPFRNASTPLAIALILAAVLGVRRRDWEFPCLLLGGLALVGFHDLWREYPRDYYFAPLGVLGAFGLLQVARSYPRLGFLLVCLGCLWNGKHLLDDPPLRAWQREMTMAGRFVDRFVPPGESIGCFNSGIVTWERAGRVVNLDGVVNAEAFAALKKGALLDYLQASKVMYLLDNPIQFQRQGVHSNGRHFGPGFDAGRDLEEIARFVWPAEQGLRRAGMNGFRLYRRRSTAPDPDRVVTTADLGLAPGGQGRWVLWSGRRGQVLRSESEHVLSADSDCVYVVQVPWDRHQGVRLFVDGATEPVLTIAPD
jgi:hypothetical protein